MLFSCCLGGVYWPALSVPKRPRFVEAAMHARSTHYVVKPERFDDFLDAISQSVPLMRQQKGFHSLLVLRVVGANPPELRVMTVWESQQALQDSERNVYFYQAVSRALAFSSGFRGYSKRKSSSATFPTEARPRNSASARLDRPFARQ